jgi:ABC-type antimicrobial peptide transport system permease subunit
MSFVRLLIAMIGVYAMTAYGISRRQREMNIRVALGASRPGVVALVVRQAAVPLIAGVGLGVVVSLGASTAVAALLFEMSARDPAIVSGVAALAIITGILSSFSAARTGVSVDPAAVLRDE